jgi:predicted amidohydrolase YtcJ
MLAACSSNWVPRAQVNPSQQTIYHSGLILTMDPEQPFAQAMAIRGDTIESVGGDEDVLAVQDEQAITIDLQGRNLMPGFVDAHSHVFNDRDKMDLSLDEAQDLALSHGITTLADLFVDRRTFNDLKRFADGGFLRVRTHLYLVAADNCGRPQGNWYKEHPPSMVPGEMLWVNGVKLFADGGTCGEPAFSFELETGGGLGDLWFEQAEINELVVEAQAAGYQVAIHAVGDRATVQALNAIEYALAGGPNRLRHRIEHASVVPPEHAARFGELAVSPVYFGKSFSCTEEHGLGVPEQFYDWDQPIAATREINPDLNIGWSTDTPYGSEDPFVSLFGFVTRRDFHDGRICPPLPWHEDDTLSVDQALSIMTIESAYVLNREQEIGSLAPGKLADFIVLSGNPRTVEPDRLLDLEVLLTVVGGVTEYCLPEDPDLCPGFTTRQPVR